MDVVTCDSEEAEALEGTWQNNQESRNPPTTCQQHGGNIHGFP